MVVTTVQAAITAMTAHAQSGREYSARSTTANRKTASARHNGSELERFAPAGPAVTVTMTKLHSMTSAVMRLHARARGRVADLAEPGQGVLADQRVLVHRGRDVDVAVDAYRGKRRPPAEERAVAGEGGQHAQQRGVQPQRVHRPPVLRRGQAERERDIHQAQRGLDIEVEQAAGSGLRIDLRDREHAEIELTPG